MPPKAPPVVPTPVARPRRDLNQWPMAATEGEKIREVQEPIRTPKVSMKWKYSAKELASFE